MDVSPLTARPCTCDDEPAGDPREMTCIRCGRQIGGVPLPGSTALRPAQASPLPAQKRRRYDGVL